MDMTLDNILIFFSGKALGCEQMLSEDRLRAMWAPLPRA
jgi:hypothetical protein